MPSARQPKCLSRGVVNGSEPHPCPSTPSGLEMEPITPMADPALNFVAPQPTRLAVRQRSRYEDVGMKRITKSRGERGVEVHYVGKKLQCTKQSHISGQWLRYERVCRNRLGCIALHCLIW